MADENPYENNEMQNSVVPVYKFEWDDGTMRTTASLPQVRGGIEELARMGRNDQSCEVTLVGYQN